MEQQTKASPEARNVVNFLRSSKAGMKIRVGVLNGKRIDYFKGASDSPKDFRYGSVRRRDGTFFAGLRSSVKHGWRTSCQPFAPAHGQHRIRCAVPLPPSGL